MSGFKIVNHVNDNLIQEMIELDKLVFSGVDVGVLNKCKKWVKINPKIYTILMKGDKVIGYINFMPITNDCYTKIREGHLKDNELECEDIITFKTKQPLKCLFTSIVIHPKFQTGLALTRLWKGFLNKLKPLNLTVESVIMDCVTEMGEKCAKNYLKAQFVTNSFNGKIYEGNIKEF